MKFDDEQGPLARAASAWQALIPHCSIIRGSNSSTGERITFLRCGGTHPVEKRFFIGHVMDALEEERAIGRVPFWSIKRLAQEVNADFTLIHLDQTLAAPAEKFIKQAVSQVVIRAPLMIEAVVDLRDEKRLLSTHSLQGDIRRVRKKAFSVEPSSKTVDLVSFIRQFRDPYAAKRHGLDALSFQYDPELFAQDSFAGKGFLLLKIMRQDQWVAAIVIVDSLRGRPALWELGVKDGDTTLVKDGAVAAAYWLGIQYLKQKGAKTVSLSALRPFINEGVFVYKSKFKPDLRTSSSRRVLIVPNLTSPTAQTILSREPIVAEAGGKLTPVGFRASGPPDPLEAHTSTLKNYGNLEAPSLIEFSHIQLRPKPDNLRKPADSPIVTDYPRDQCIHHLFHKSAAQHLDQTAVRYEDETLSYAQLLDSSLRLACNLHQCGIGTNTIVAVCADRSVHLPTWVIAVLRSGAAYLPLDPALPIERLQFMLEDSGAQALIVDETTRALFQKSPPPCPVIDGPRAISMPPSSELTALPDTTKADDLAYVIYTSGSTGLPKGVEIIHRNLINLLWSMKERLGLRPQERVLSIGSFAFDVTLPDWFWAFLSGGSVIIAAKMAIKDPGQLVPLIAQHRPTHIQATPGTWEMLLKVGLLSYHPLRLVTTGEHVSESLRARLRTLSSDVWNLYGPTETTVWSSACQLSRDRSPDSIGEPIANTQFYIVDETGRPTTATERGELWIGGDGVARGYLNRPDLTATRFITPPWAPSERLYRTGDLVERTPEGTVRYLGRVDDQVKIRGYRIELGEIDATLSRHPDIRVSQTLMVEGKHSRRLISFVVPQFPRQDPRLWKDFLLNELPAYMVPAQIIVLERLPLTPNGKIDRDALRAHLDAPPQADSRSKLNPIQMKVADVWRSVLAKPHVTLSDTFWDLGGDSLSAVHMLLELKHRLGIEVPYEQLHANPTLQEFCAIGRPQQTDHARLRPLRTHENPTTGPLLITHGHNFGNTLDELGPLVHSLDTPAAIWGLSGHGEDGRPWVYQTLPAMASDALKLIQKALSPGKISLLGYCVGGLLAYELALQLSVVGYDVVSVIMIDTATPRLRNSVVAEARRRRKRELQQSLRQWSIASLKRYLVARWKFERRYLPDRFWRHVAPFWIRIRPLPSEARTAHYQAVQSSAFTRYEPPALNVPVYLIKTDQNNLPSDYGWGAHCPKFHQSFLSAPHHKMVSKEQATRLGQHISTILMERS